MKKCKTKDFQFPAIRHLILFTGLLFAVLAHGQDLPKTLLWKVTKKGSKNQSYLFGTFHEVGPAFFNSLNNAKRKLQESDILFVEQQMSAIKPLEVTAGPSWNFERWDKILTKEQKAIFQEFVERIADTTCYQQSPLELLLGISRNYLLTFCETDTGSNELMDNYIEKIAINENKKIHSLDFNQQAIINNSTLGSTSSQDSVYANACTIGMKNTIDRDLAGCSIITSYRNLDINYELTATVPETAANKSLLIERNRNWILTLDKSFASANCFVAVGYQHLRYKQGLIEQLRKIGYQVTPIPSIL